MDTRQLGTSDLRITPIGFGAWAIGGSGWEFGWGGQDDRDSTATIREALDAGDLATAKISHQQAVAELAEIAGRQQVREVDGKTPRRVLVRERDREGRRPG